MNPVILAVLHDNLARFNLGDLTTQSRMELLIADFDASTTERFFEANGDHKSISEWKWVVCDDEGEVKKLQWGQYFEFEDETSFSLAVVPDTVTHLQLEYNNLCGTLETIDLPTALIRLNLSGNGFTGTVNTSNIPRKVEYFFVIDNALSGPVDFQRFPSSVRVIGLAGNRFSGEVLLHHLPSGVRYVYLQGNDFSGKADFENVPDSVVRIDLQNNANLGNAVLYQPQK